MNRGFSLFLKERKFGKEEAKKPQKGQFTPIRANSPIFLDVSKCFLCANDVLKRSGFFGDSILRFFVKFSKNSVL